MLNRRHFLSLSAASLSSASLSAILATGRLGAAAGHPIAEYDLQGIHRTGTAVDRASGEWLAGLVRTAGLPPVLEPFRLSRVDPVACFAQAGSKRMEGLPMFDGTFTGAQGITGRLGNEIGFIEAVPNNEGGPLLELRRSGKHTAIVAVTSGSGPQLSPINAANFTKPYGPPVLLVAKEEAEVLRGLLATNAEIRVTVQVNRTDVEAVNVTAIRKGSRPELAPLVVMTPRSGWWNCASERGGGIYCWLEVMKAVKAPARDVMFVASSGHELGHLGLDHFIHDRTSGSKGIIKDAAAWMHFGANIGAATGPAGTLQFSDEAMQRLAVREMTPTGIRMNQRPLGQAPAGEAGNIHRGGGRYVSLVGGNELFHSPADRWPQAVDTASLEKIAQAFRRIAQDLAGA